MKFFKEWLSGKKIVWIVIYNLLVLKTSDIKQIKVSKYLELKVYTFYEYTKTMQELLKFLPDYKRSQKPDKEYLFNFIGNEEPEFLSAKIVETHKNRMSGEITEDSEKIQIREDILYELMKTNYESSEHWLLILLYRFKGKRHLST